MNKCKNGKCTAKTLLDAVNCPFNCHFTVEHWCAMEQDGECTNTAALADVNSVEYHTKKGEKF